MCNLKLIPLLIAMAQFNVITDEAAGNLISMTGAHSDMTKHQQAEVALQESEARYRQLIDNLNAGFVIHAPDTSILLFNSTACELLGVSMDQMLGKTALDSAWHFLREDGTVLPIAEYPVNQVLSTEMPIKNYVLGINRGNKPLVWVLVNAFPEFDNNGEIKQVVITFIDISDRKQAEEEIKQTRNFLQALLDHLPVAVFVKDAQPKNFGVFQFWNKTSERLFGISAAQALGKTAYDLFPTAQANFFEQKDREVFAKGRAEDILEEQIDSQTLSKRWLHTVKVPIYDEQDRPHYLLGFSQDITHRKQAEAELREMSEVLENAVSGISKLDTQGCYLYVNKAYADPTGYQPEEMIGMRWEKTVHPNELAKMVAAYEYMVETGRVEVETTGIRKDGSVFYKQLVMIATYDEKHQVLGHYCFMKDISDRKQKELALRQAMAAAEAANLAKSIFLANMSHELRTPLNVILGFAQVMAHDSALTPSQQEDLQTIRRSGDHLLSLINDVLDLSKIESGHCTIEESGFDLMALLHSLRTMLAERASSKGLDLWFEIAPEVPQFAIADAQKLRQVLLNLLSNAIKFTHRGSITLQVSIKADSIKATPTTRPILQFVVTDTGVGIAAEELDNIFDTFVQAQAGKQSVGGTGLGLTISRKLLHLMGGDISVSSTLGRGTSFTFTLPVSPTSEVNITPEPSDRFPIRLTPGQPHHRILVVDDGAENRLLMVKLLKQVGLEVIEATNGQEAVQIWQQYQPDLIWMDIRMPVLDGYEATKQIRAMESGQKCIIIALTAQASQSDRTLALAAGCNDYITKPFREQTLFLKMAEYLGLQYRYAEPSTLGEAQICCCSSENQALDALKPTLVTTLPAAWLAELEDAAVCGDDVAIADLTAQLSPEFAQLATRLTEFANQYQFEQILQLIHENSTT